MSVRAFGGDARTWRRALPEHSDQIVQIDVERAGDGGECLRRSGASAGFDLRQVDRADSHCRGKRGLGHAAVAAVNPDGVCAGKKLIYDRGRERFFACRQGEIVEFLVGQYRFCIAADESLEIAPRYDGKCGRARVVPNDLWLVHWGFLSLAGRASGRNSQDVDGLGFVVAGEDDAASAESQTITGTARKGVDIEVSAVWSCGQLVQFTLYATGVRQGQFLGQGLLGLSAVRESMHGGFLPQSSIAYGISDTKHIGILIVVGGIMPKPPIAPLGGIDLDWRKERLVAWRHRLGPGRGATLRGGFHGLYRYDTGVGMTAAARGEDG